MDVTTTTVLRTDIDGAAALAAHLGDQRWSEVRGEHDDWVRYCIALHNGTEIRHRGDGLLAVFASTRRAVRSALAIQDAVGGLAARLHVPLRVRVGVHRGEALLGHDDIRGLAVIHAARITAAAPPGAVVVSGAVRDAAQDDVSLHFADADLLQLRGMDGATAVHVVSRADAPVALVR